MSLRFKIFTAIFIIFLFGVGAYFFILNKERKEGTQFNFKTETTSRATILGDGFKKFSHPKYNFSLEYPEELGIEAFRETDDAETVIFKKLGQNESTPREEKIGFQIFIAPFEEGEKGPLTTERILEDVQFLTIDEPQEVILGISSSEEEVRALIFLSDDPDIGKTREVWFTHGGYLYEITTYAHLDSWLAQILSTLTFTQ